MLKSPAVTTKILPSNPPFLLFSWRSVYLAAWTGSLNFCIRDLELKISTPAAEPSEGIIQRTWTLVLAHLCFPRLPSKAGGLRLPVALWVGNLPLLGHPQGPSAAGPWAYGSWC